MAAAEPYVPTSQIFGGMLAEATDERVTLEWLLGNLGERSFGIMLLFLALIGLVPDASTFTAILLFVPAWQMIVARPYPTLPRMIGRRRLSVARLERLLARAIPVLRWFERFSYPRWPTPFETTKRVIGVVVMLLAVTLFSPIPFAHVLPNLVIMLIAFSFLEKDGVLLSLSAFMALVSLGVTATSVWTTIIVPRQF